MKNAIKLTLGLLISMAIITSCNKTEELDDVPAEKSEQFLQENIAVYDAIIRSLDKTHFVKEVFMKNFSDQAWDKTSIGFMGHLFEDNGKGNDLEANDGIYTSVDVFAYDKTITYDENAKIKSVMSNPIVSSNFNQVEALERFTADYERPNNEKAGGTATITCDVEICSTGCIADWIWDGFGCVCVSNCSVTIGW